MFIYKNGNVYELTFSDLNNCLIIKSHFDSFSLMTYKLIYYKVWCQVLKIISFKALFKKDDTNYYINPSIRITQNNISLLTLQQIVTLLGLGKIYSDGRPFASKQIDFLLL